MLIMYNVVKKYRVCFIASFILFFSKTWCLVLIILICSTYNTWPQQGWKEPEINKKVCFIYLIFTETWCLVLIILLCSAYNTKPQQGWKRTRNQQISPWVYGLNMLNMPWYRKYKYLCEEVPLEEDSDFFFPFNFFSDLLLFDFPCSNKGRIALFNREIKWKYNPPHSLTHAHTEKN